MCCELFEFATNWLVHFFLVFLTYLSRRQTSFDQESLKSARETTSIMLAYPLPRDVSGQVGARPSWPLIASIRGSSRHSGRVRSGFINGFEEAPPQTETLTTARRGRRLPVLSQASMKSVVPAERQDRHRSDARGRRAAALPALTIDPDFASGIQRARRIRSSTAGLGDQLVDRIW